MPAVRSAAPGGRSGAWDRGTGGPSRCSGGSPRAGSRRRARGAGTSAASRRSSSRPPKTRPKQKPLAPNALKIASALLRDGPSVNVVVIRESAAGTVNAAATPLRKRAAISSVPSSTIPPSERGEREHGQRAEQHAPAAEQVGRAAAEQQHAAEAEHVRGDDPLQLGGGQTEIGLDRRKRDADHRDVESVEEDDPAQQDQGAPKAGVPRRGGSSHAPHHTCMCI